MSVSDVQVSVACDRCSRESTFSLHLGNGEYELNEKLMEEGWDLSVTSDSTTFPHLCPVCVVEIGDPDRLY